MKEYSQVRVLVAEDQAAMRMVISMILEGLGVGEVVEAEDGESAALELRSRYFGGNPTEDDDKFDLIISDWKMPNKSGIELLKEVRCNPRLKHLPYLMVTCLDDQQSVDEAREEGVTSYLTKPFSAKDLRQEISAALEKRSRELPN